MLKHIYKKLLTLSIVTLLLSNLNIYGQSAFPIIKDGKWGAINAKGDIIIPPSYSFIKDFQKNDLAIAEKDNLVGVINAKGETVLPFQYQKIELINEDKAVIWKNYKCGLITLSGKEIMTTAYEGIRTLTKYIYVFQQNSKFGIADQEGNELLPAQYNILKPFKSNLITEFGNKGKIGLINRKGDIIAEPKYQKITVNKGNALAVDQTTLTYITFDQEGILKSSKDFPNQKMLQRYLAYQERKARAKEGENDPNPEKPRWTFIRGNYELTDGKGKNLLNGMRFYYREEDNSTGLSLAKGEGKTEEEDYFYLIDHTKPAIIFQKSIKDIVLVDYAESKWARATKDTLYDALISKTGELKTTINNKPITDVGRFDKGIAAVKSNGSYGYINGDANVIIPFQYEVGSDFNNGYAVAKKGGKFGAINRKGDSIIPFQYDGISAFSEGVFRVKKGPGVAGRWGVVDTNNKTVIPFEYNLIGEFKGGKANVLKNGKWGTVSKTGKVIIPPTIPVDYLGAFENGIAEIKDGVYTEKRGDVPVVQYKRYGFLNEDGTVLIKPVYSRINNFKSIWQKQQGVTQLYKDGKIGFVNYMGEIVLPAEYTSIQNYKKVWETHNGIALAQKGKKYGYIDYNGEEVLTTEYDFIGENFPQIWKDSTGVAKARKEGKMGMIDFEGNEIIPFIYDDITEVHRNIAIVRTGKKYGAINLQNKELLAVKYDKVNFIEDSDNQFLKVWVKDKATFYVDEKGLLSHSNNNTQAKQSQSPKKNSKYEYASDFDSEGFASVYKAGKKNNLGVINLEGKLITKLKYAKIGKFNDGLAYVQIQDKSASKRLYGFIDTNGKEVIAPSFNKAEGFNEDLAPAMKRGKWGYINKKGTWAIPPQFKSATLFSNGFAITNSEIIIDKEGNIVGRYKAKGKITGTFHEERARVQVTGGEYHILPNGAPAYNSRYDEVTDFKGKVAFVKRGEIWELTRTFNDKPKKIRMNKREKEAYIEKFGKKRKIVTPYGDIIKDKGFEKVSNGKWKMIYNDGSLVSEALFDNVDSTSSQFTVTVSQLSGIAGLNGEFIIEPKSVVIRASSNDIIKVEQEGTIKYFNTEGKVIY